MPDARDFSVVTVETPPSDITHIGVVTGELLCGCAAGRSRLTYSVSQLVAPAGTRPHSEQLTRRCSDCIAARYITQRLAGEAVRPKCPLH